MKPENIILEGDKLLEDMSKVNKRLYDKIIEFVTLNIKDGKVSISNEDLAKLEDILYNEVKDSDYEENLIKYVALFDALLNSIDQEQVKANKLRVNAVKNLWTDLENNKDIINKVINDLGRSGIRDVMLRGIADAVREVNYFNLDYKSAVNVLKEKLYGEDGVDNSYVQRYVKQVAFDSLSQYDGAIQDKVRDTYGFTKFSYVGNSIETSRPFCVHLADTLGGEKLTIEQLQQALNEYCPGGVPSDKQITYEANGVQKKSKKGAGMIPGTTKDNFSQLKGGYNCRHRVLWGR